MVGTKIQVKDLIQEMGQEFNLPYVNQRWIGGTFTNFEELKKRIDYFKDLESKKEQGLLEKYTKKEKMKIEEKIRKLTQKFGGLKKLTELPDAIFVSDMKQDELACREARAKRIRIIGIADTNINPELADFVIPANDDAASSLRYILGKVREAIIKGKEEAEEAEKGEEATKD